MADPVSIAGLSLQVIQILAPLLKALRRAYKEGKTVHDTLSDLHSDLDAVYELTANINRLFSVSTFINAVRSIQDDINVTLVLSLERSLDGCSKEAQRLLDILIELGLQPRDGRTKQAILQWRLDRRMDNIDRLKRNFQDHKSSIQLAFQLLTTCKQMQIAERDARSAAELKVQIGELQKAIEQISHQISIRQVTPNDEEQTQLLDDMKDIQIASVGLQRRATLRLDYLTSLSETANIVETSASPEQSIDGKFQTAQASRPLVVVSEEAQLDVPATHSTAASIAESSNKTHNNGSTTSVATNVYSTNSIDRNSKLLVAPPVTRLRSSSDSSLHEYSPISSQEFESDISRLLASATDQHMGIKKPYSEDIIAAIADLLAAVGKVSWSGRPRTYLVLRLINEVKRMDDMILDGYKDIDFPYTDTTLPRCIRDMGAQRDFLQTQRFVLSEKSADLVRGGRHRHLDKSADSIFVSIGKLGSGGFSVVDRVRLRSRLTLQDYARKRIERNGAFAKDRKALVSFENEVHNLKRLSHQHLVKFVGSYTDKRYIGIIMQPVANIDLHRHLSKGEWSEDELVTLRSWVGCLCSALAYLHKNKCRHKDLKPHNILIDGDIVLLADFGTAFDWSEHESEITVGAPEAYTKLYVAPEVGLQQPRDTSSDVWSLGCIFLEMATILSGKLLEAKTEFFGSLDNSSTAYWRNHAAIGGWIAILREYSSEADERLFSWIETMTSLESSLRPTAQDLVEEVSNVSHGTLRYGRHCCFDELISDTTSWEGSITDDDIFETANTISEMTTVSSTGLLVPGGRSTSGYVSSPPLAQQSKTIALPILRTGERATTVKQHHQSSVHGAGTYPSEISTPAETGSLPDVQGLGTPELVHSAKDIAPDFGTIDSGNDGNESSEALHDHGSPPVVIADSESTTTALPVSPSTHFPDLIKAFFRSHQHLEESLIQIRDQRSRWTPLVSMAQDSIRDKKGYNILLVACKFSNVVISKDVISFVLRQNPGLVHTSTIFLNTPLHYLALRGRADTINLLVKAGARPGTKNSCGHTPLHVALRTKNWEAANALIPHLSAAEICASNHFGNQPIHLAIAWRAPVQIVQALLNSGAQLTSKNRTGYDAIDHNSQDRGSAITTLLLKHTSTRSKMEGVSGLPPLQEQLRQFDGKIASACFCDSCLMMNAVCSIEAPSGAKKCPCPNHIRALIQDTLSGYRIENVLRLCPCAPCVAAREYNQKNPACGTPLDDEYKSYNESLDSSSLLDVRLKEPSAYSGIESTPHLKPYFGHGYYDRLIEKKMSLDVSKIPAIEVTKQLLQIVSDAPRSSYSQSVPDRTLQSIIKNHTKIAAIDKIVGTLLDCGGNVDILSGGSGLLSVAATTGNRALMRTLLDRKANVDLAVRREVYAGSVSSPLQFAIENKHASVARMLLTAGANVNIQYNTNKTTPLHKAASDAEKLGTCIPLLLAHGALTELKDANGNTPLHLAVTGGHLSAARFLLECGADVNAVNTKKDSCLGLAIQKDASTMIKLLLLYGADVHAPCGSGSHCALFFAVQQIGCDMVRILLDDYSADKDLNRVDIKERRQGLLHVIAAGRLGAESGDMAELIIRRGGDVNAMDEYQYTPLHRAALSNNIHVAKKLLENGAMTNKMNVRDLTPLGLAKEYKHPEMVSLLGGTYKKSWWKR